MHWRYWFQSMLFIQSGFWITLLGKNKFFLKRKNTEHQKYKRSKHVWLIVRQLPMKADWWDNPLALRDLVEAIPRISDNGLPLLIENNFQTPPTPFNWTPSPTLLLFGSPVYWYLVYLSDPPFIKTSPPYLLELESTSPVVFEICSKQFFPIKATFREK